MHCYKKFLLDIFCLLFQNGKDEAESKPSTSTVTRDPPLVHKKPNSSKALLSNLVRVRKPDVASATDKSDSNSNSVLQGSTSQNGSPANVKPVGALGMLGNYSSSDTDSD